MYKIKHVIPAKVGIHNKTNSKMDPRLKHSGVTSVIIIILVLMR